MRQFTFALIALAVGACSPSTDQPPMEEEGPDEVVEREPITLELIEPMDGATVADPNLWVRALVTAPHGVARLGWRDGAGVERELTAPDETEFLLEFEVTLRLGGNEITLFAEDDDENLTEVAFEVTYENISGQPAKIEFFEADPPWALQGEQVELRWQVTGTRPISLRLTSTSGASFDVSDDTSILWTLGADRAVLFTLRATNEVEGGVDVATLTVGVGEELRVWPSEATIQPNVRQWISVENADEVEWEASGGRIEMDEGRTYFVSEEPGTYTLTATTALEQEPRSATATITVREQVSTVQRFEWMGGRIGGALSLSPSGAVDEAGRIWIPTQDGFSLWRPEEETWSFVGDSSWSTIHGVYEDPAGGLVAVGDAARLRLDPGSETWHVEALLPELPRRLRNTDRFTVDQAGTVYLYDTRLNAAGALWALAPGSSAWESLPLPEEAKPQALAFDDSGGLLLAAKHGEMTKVWHAPAAGAEWSETGSIPEPTEPIRDLLVDPSGEVLLAGHTLFALGDEGWEARGSFPSCEPGSETCGIFDLALRSDGALLVVTRHELFVREPDGTFTDLEALVEEPALHPQYGGLHRVLEGPDGTLYLRGDFGLYAKPPGTDPWAVVGDKGIMAKTVARSLIVAPDGGLILGSGGDYGDPLGRHSFYHRGSDDERWTGFGNRCFNVFSAEPISEFGQDRAGTLYAVSYSGGWVSICSLPVESEEATPIHVTDETIVENVLRPYYRSFGVAADGTLFLSGADEVNMPVVYRLPPGSDTWRKDTSLPCASQFVQTPDATFWAMCSFPYRRVGGSWQEVSAGLPLGHRSVGDDVLGVADGGGLLLAGPHGTFRLPPGASRWERLGFGPPNLGATRITGGGGRYWAVAGGQLYELLPETETWVEVDAWLPGALSGAAIFAGSPDGRLLFSRGSASTFVKSVHYEGESP